MSKNGRSPAPCGGDRASDAVYIGTFDGSGNTPSRTSTQTCADPQRVQTWVDFEAVDRAALAALPDLLARWLPGGRQRGREYVARNPRRGDRNPGSFSINVKTGCWADFAIAGASGGDVISLAAYLAGLSRLDAAINLARMLGVKNA